MGDEREISFPDGGMIAADSGMSIHSCNKPDYHHRVKQLETRVRELEAEMDRLKTEVDRQKMLDLSGECDRLRARHAALVEAASDVDKQKLLGGN